VTKVEPGGLGTQSRFLSAFEDIPIKAKNEPRAHTQLYPFSSCRAGTAPRARHGGQNKSFGCPLLFFLASPGLMGARRACIRGGTNYGQFDLQAHLTLFQHGSPYTDAVGSKTELLRRPDPLDLPGELLACNAPPWVRLATYFHHKSQRPFAPQLKRFGRGRRSISGSQLKCHQLLGEAAASAIDHKSYGACNTKSRFGR